MKNCLLTLSLLLVWFVGKSQQTFNESVIVTTSSNPTLTLHESSPSTPFELTDNATVRGSISKTNTSGTALIDIDPLPTDGTGDALFRFFRKTNTSGVVAFDVLRGNNSAQPNSRLSGNGNSFLNAVSGNVGVGTTSPQSKLSVKGRIESQEVQVKANVADYVFYENYQLMSLDEVENYIKENGHLPRIQTQEDVENNRGLVKVGELSISLMEKVEELTLHMIEMNKRINSLEKENNYLKVMMKSHKKSN